MKVFFGIHLGGITWDPFFFSVAHCDMMTNDIDDDADDDDDSMMIMDDG